MKRKAKISRKTKETNINVEINTNTGLFCFSTNFTFTLHNLKRGIHILFNYGNNTKPGLEVFNLVSIYKL